MCDDNVYFNIFIFWLTILLHQYRQYILTYIYIYMNDLNMEGTVLHLFL